MTEIILLDKNFQPISFIDGFLSVIWNRSYTDTGSFELHLQGEYYEDISLAQYVYCEDMSETGIIEKIKVNSTDNIVVAQGRFLLALLDNRVVANEPPQETICASEYLYELVRCNCIDQGERSIEKLSVAAESPLLGGPVKVSAAGENLLQKVLKVAQEQGLRCSIRLDYFTKQLFFEVTEGADRSAEQRELSTVIFSEEYGNVVSANYEQSKKEYKNFAYVVGEYTDSANNKKEVVAEVDLRENTPSPEERREIWVKASDVKNDKDNNTEANLKSLLVQYGKEKLAEYQPVKTADVKAGTTGGLEYKRDYDLGDLCTYEDMSLGIQVNKRITEIIETIQNNEHGVELVFGKDELSVVKKIRREL